MQEESIEEIAKVFNYGLNCYPFKSSNFSEEKAKIAKDFEELCNLARLGLKFNKRSGRKVIKK